MKKILTIVGARPQFVKAAVLSRIFKEKDVFKEVILHTGQHFDTNMSAVFFEEMSIQKPDYHFEIHSMPRTEMIHLMVQKIIKVIEIEKPAALLVYGDTNSTLAGAISADKKGVKLIHVEAGLRSFNLEMPEERNRIATDALSDLLLCPSQTAINNLLQEAKTKSNACIVNSGDIMNDAVDYYSRFSEEKSNILQDLKLTENTFILATIHRQDNTDTLENLKAIFDALQEITKETQVIMPLHPRTKKALEKHQLQYNLTFIDPVGYFDMLALLKNCSLVITDSGGLQKEAFFCKKFAIIARAETEWVELIDHKFANLVGANAIAIIKAYKTYKKNDLDFSVALYGDNVGEKIHQEIVTLIN